MVAVAIGAPPKPPSRQADSSADWKRGSSRIRLYIAGTSSVCVMRSRSASSRKSAALKARMTISVPAACTMAAISATTPVTWLMGTARTARSCLVRPMQHS